MASRGVVRTGRSPHGSRVRAAAAAPAWAALPHSHSCLLPPRSDSSSSPMPLCLLLLFILLLLEDAGAQQGEWSPENARCVEPHGRRGRGESHRGARPPGHWPNRRRLREMLCASVRGRTWHGTHEVVWERWDQFVVLKLARLYFWTRLFIFLREK